MAATEEILGFIRKNGYECPWNYHQVTSYLLFFMTTTIFFAQIVPFYSNPYNKALLVIIFSLILFFLGYFLLKLTNSDPTDPIVIEYRACQSCR